MAVTNLYSNLPGHLVEFKDGGLQLTSTTTDTSSTKSLLILGTALDGPINEPVKIDAVTVSQVFGKEVDADGYPNGTTLTKYAKQAFKNGFDDVRCMRVTGSQAYTTIYGHETVGYVTDSAVVNADGTEATDGTGIINSNSEIFKKDYSDNASPVYVIDEAIMDGSDRIDGIYINDGTERIIGLGSTSGGASEATWSPYHGFSIDANKFGKLNKLALKCKAIKFVGDTDATTYSFTTEKKSVTETGGALDSIVFTVPSTPITGSAPEFFKEASAHGTLNDKLPDVTGIDLNGFIVKVNDAPLVEGTDYTGSYLYDDITSTGTYTITPIASGRIKTAYDADPTVEVSIT